AAGIRNFVALHHATFERKDLYAKNMAYFNRLISTLVALNHGAIFFAEYQGIRLATILLIYFGKRATYFFGGSPSAHRNTMAPYVLHFEAMRKAKRLGCEEYDFYGVAPADQADHPWAKVSTFKRKFGGYEQHFIRPADTIFDAEGYSEYLRERKARREKKQ
ncbi:MAG: lipid II:glycine glycyltransferase FemX, partial [Bythopirellula sp.]